ncbi:MAG TPA: FtsJ-like methyltransferase family protein [Allocoleopsis sp.]
MCSANRKTLEIKFDVSFEKHINLNKDLGNYQDLFDIKNKIEQYTLRQWTRVRKDSDFSFDRKRYISRAYFKLKEILVNFDIPFYNIQNTFHICEAPGGFIKATYDFYYKKYNYNNLNSYTVSLKNTSKLKTSDTPVFNPIVAKIVDIVPGDGDITKFNNFTYYVNYLRNKKISFITADGGLPENGQFNMKESLHVQLIFSEIVLALNVLEDKGIFIIKIFDIFTDITVQFIFLLTYLFEETYLFKPTASRKTNSEKYLVCKFFNKQRFLEIKTQINFTLYRVLNTNRDVYLTNLLSKEIIPSGFISQIKEFNRNFIQNQISSISNVLERCWNMYNTGSVRV